MNIMSRGPGELQFMNYAQKECPYACSISVVPLIIIIIIIIIGSKPCILKSWN
jgi:hypothetical protein